MSVMLVIKELELDNNVNHVATDWEVSDTISFINKVLVSKEDRDNLTSITFPDVLDPSKDWYARARPLLTTGYKAWGNVDVFRPVNVDNIKDYKDLPSRVGTPHLTTDGIREDHDKTLFNLIATGYDVVGNSIHESTSWYIEDTNGDVIWSRIKDIFNKNKILVNEVILKSNQVYRVKCMFHTSTNDVSDITTYIIKTSGKSDIFVTSYLDGLDITKPIELVINNIEGTSLVTWEILSVTKDVSESIWKAKTKYPIVIDADNTGIDFNNPGETEAFDPLVQLKDEINKVLVPSDTLKEDSTYLLKVFSDKSNGVTILPFFTTNTQELANNNNNNMG